MSLTSRERAKRPARELPDTRIAGTLIPVKKETAAALVAASNGIREAERAVDDLSVKGDKALKFLCAAFGAWAMRVATISLIVVRDG